jgi:tetratricopeptide (TPR) repeat protein
MEILLLVGFAVVIGFLVARRVVVAEPDPQTALQVFTSRPTWQTFPAQFLEALASRLQSIQKAREFVSFCESTEILYANIIKYAQHETQFALGFAATTLTSYANAMGQQQKPQEAQCALEFAILIRPEHVWAWASLALVNFDLKNCQAAVTWANKVLNFKPDPNNNDPFARGVASFMTPEGEQRAAMGLQDPGVIGSFAALREQLTTIIELCRRKAGT